MNPAHRFADGVRSVVGYFTPTSNVSRFTEKGTLTPKEFVEAGDLLALKFPLWTWKGASGKRQVSWLPADKQYLALYGVTSNCRVTDLDVSSSSEGGEWILPGGATSTSEENMFIIAKEDEASPERIRGAATHENMFSDLDEQLLACNTTTSDGESRCSQINLKVRAYDLSVTYDKYYQCPRLWLRGFTSRGVPLTANEVFEDILSQYISKTVTIDPHPCTGELSVSIHPCKHAEMMKRVVERWRSRGRKPR